ncbi:MAG: flagellar brake protein [Burkholderiales bacterium]
MQFFAQTPSNSAANEAGNGEERYVLRTRRDVLPVFSALAKWPIPISTRLIQLGTAHVSRLIAVNPAFEELVFDATGLPGVERLDGSEGLVGEAQMDAVWFRFEADHVEAVRGYVQPAFRARLPKILSRMQRRDSIRYPVPAMNPPVCDFRLGESSVRLRSIDISLSGIALLVEDSKANLSLQTTLADCLLHLPGIGAISTDLFVAYLAPFGESDQRRLGCRFSNVKATSLSHLHRYVQRLERERLSMLETQLPAGSL